MKSLRTVTVVAALAGIFFMGVEVLAQQEYETPVPRPVKAALPKELAAGPNYKVADPAHSRTAPPLHH